MQILGNMLLIDLAVSPHDLIKYIVPRPSSHLALTFGTYLSLLQCAYMSSL